MSSPEEILRAAVADHRAGLLVTAEVGYSKVLRKLPDDPRALLGMGLLSYHGGAKERGIDYLLRSLRASPDNGVAWNTLGSMYAEMARPVEAKVAYQRATEAAPELSEAWYNLAVCTKRDGDRETAVQQLRRALACPTRFPTAHDMLASTLYELGRLEESSQTLAEWMAREPANPIAQHLAAAASGVPPPRASDAYVRRHFDSFADAFDATLEKLGYRAPELVAAALEAAMEPGRGASPERGKVAGRSAALPVLLDAGCGTGLCGPLVRRLCRRLVGVDLSTRMLAHAQQRGCYDELAAEELGAFMRSRPGAFDAIVCADTLVYFGSLAEPLAAAREALHRAAPLVFTLEALPEGEAADHRVEPTGRYSHSEKYLRRVLAAGGFEVESIGKQILRTEKDADVAGYLVVARRL